MNAIKNTIFSLAMLTALASISIFAGDFKLDNKGGRDIWIAVLNGKSIPAFYEKIAQNNSIELDIDQDKETILCIWTADPKGIQIRAAWVLYEPPQLDPTPDHSYKFTIGKKIQLKWMLGDILEPMKGVRNNVQVEDIKVIQHIEHYPPYPSYEIPGEEKFRHLE